MTDSTNPTDNKNPMESLGRLVGGILGLTLLTMWITIVATFTHNWYVGN